MIEVIQIGIIGRHSAQFVTLSAIRQFAAKKRKLSITVGL